MVDLCWAGALSLGAGEVFMLGILRKVTSSCSAIFLCNSLVSDLDRRQPVLFPQILKTHYALLQKVSVPSLKMGESEA